MTQGSEDIVKSCFSEKASYPHCASSVVLSKIIIIIMVQPKMNLYECLNIHFSKQSATLCWNEACRKIPKLCMCIKTINSYFSAFADRYQMVMLVWEHTCMFQSILIWLISAKSYCGLFKLTK